MSTDALRPRLREKPLLCAEGYLFELERRGYLQAGPFVPEVVLDHPEVVEQVHRDFVRAGSDVVEALTYYAHREKLRVVDGEGSLDELNRQALAIASRVAREHGALLAGNICNTNIYDPDDAESHRRVRAMYDEQVAWAADAGVDYVIAETLSWRGEAAIALEAIRDADLPAVVTLAVPDSGRLLEGEGVVEACRRLEDGGAAVVGLNCFRGPATMLPLAGRVAEAVSCDVAALPVPYRTTEEHPTFLTLPDPRGGPFGDGRAFPTALEPHACTRDEMSDMVSIALSRGVRYLGLCCGASPHLVRAQAEALGRRPEASRYTPDLRLNSYLGDEASPVPEIVGTTDARA